METPPPASGPAPLPETPPAGGLTEKQWIIFLHLSALAVLVLPALGHIVGPLVLWLIKKPGNPAIDLAGREVLNFQISWTIWMAIAVALAFAFSCLVIPMVFPPAVAIAWIVFVILGAVKASNGEPYAFPLTIKML